MKVSTAVLIASLAIPSVVSAGNQEDIEAEALSHCDQDQTSLNLCSYHKYKKLDVQLNELYRKQMARYGKGSESQKRLRSAQLEWLKYIDAECLFRNGKREESGTIWPLVQNDCMIEHYADRIRVLRRYVECTRDGCP